MLFVIGRAFFSIVTVCALIATAYYVKIFAVAKKEVVASIAVLIISFSLQLVCMGAQNLHYWNNGVCPNDGAQWEFEQVTDSFFAGTHYYYKCPECNNTLRMDVTVE
jgi:hypothetical protein